MLRIPLLLLAVITLTGCGTVSTIARRSQEKSAAVASATPRQQRQMKHGFIAPDFTPDMVYVALDKPDRIKKYPDGHLERWVYYNFNRRPVTYTLDTNRTADSNFHAVTRITPNGALSGYRLDPELVKLADATTRHLVVTFLDGKVADIAILQR
ncbi:MAG: hypothetical protein JSS11_16875 [Verrucomicrobia bacterium]|nr:hypothetical protein [Verrucomicrobiota bacterium]